MRERLKRLINHTASDLEVYAHRLEGEIPVFSRAFGNGRAALTKAAELLDDFPASRDEQIDQVLPTFQQLESSIDTADAPLTGFRNTISGLPRMTTDLNKAKRHAVTALDSLLLELTKAKELTRDARRLFTGLRSFDK